MIRDFDNTLPDIGPGTYVDDTALVIGDVQIGKDSSVWPYTVIRGDVNAIRIGSQTNIQDHSILHVSHDGPAHPGGHDLQIGNNVTIGHRVTLHGCHIMNNCLIGMGAIIMDGVVIQPLSIVGAGTLVTQGKELESGYLWLGSPARRVRPLSRQEIDGIEYSARHYVELKHRHQQ